MKKNRRKLSPEPLLILSEQLWGYVSRTDPELARALAEIMQQRIEARKRQSKP